MTHTYNIEGITCNNCVDKVKGSLLTHPAIKSADLELATQKATITMDRHISLKELQQSIGLDSKYRIHETAESIMHETETKSWFATYKPLLIIGAFITGISIITAGSNLFTGMNTFMAGFFLVFSFFKLLDIKGFAESYAMYDLLAMKVPAYGYVYPFIELALGIFYLTGFNHVFTYWATIIVMGFSSVGVIRSVVDKKRIQCACLGAVFDLPMSTVTIIEDLLMVAMAAFMLAI